MSAELKRLIEDTGRAFDEFKASNDARLKEIEAKGHADPLLAEQVDKINAELSNLSALKDQVNAIEAQAGRPGFGGAADGDKAKAEHKKAFNSFFRQGNVEGLRELEVQAALTTQSDPDGGYLAPAEVDTEVTRVLGTMSAMRRIARVRPVGSATYKKIVNVGGTSSGWVGEEQSRSETDGPSLKALEFPTKELYAEPHATQSMLDDGMFDIESWLSDEVSLEFAEQEGGAFVTGSGVNSPRGILSYDTVANASYAWGSLGYIASGGAGSFADGSDRLINLVHSLKAGYRNNAAFMMNDLTLGEIRKFKNSNGDYIWKPGLLEDAYDTLLGKRVEIDDNMPDIAANSLSIAFGDFMRGYVITDRLGVRVLRDPFTSKPYVKFYTTKRVGGGVENYEAIKLMKMAAS